MTVTHTLSRHIQKHPNNPTWDDLIRSLGGDPGATVLTFPAVGLNEEDHQPQAMNLVVTSIRSCGFEHGREFVVQLVLMRKHLPYKTAQARFTRDEDGGLSWYNITLDKRSERDP